MEYSPLHDAFLISQDDLKNTAYFLKYTMGKARKLAGVGLGKRNIDGPLTELDHLEHAIIEAARRIGIEFGVQWGSELDLTDMD